MAGIVPGNDWSERGATHGSLPPASYNQPLNEFLGSALTTVRPIFAGQLTYSSGEWEDVDWSGFDVVGVDLSRDANNRAEQLHGAFVWNFIEPRNPHSPDPRHFDMVGFAVVKTYPSGHERAYDSTGHFEPKAAFQGLRAGAPDATRRIWARSPTPPVRERAQIGGLDRRAPQGLPEAALAAGIIILTYNSRRRRRTGRDRVAIRAEG